jgi:catechol 2,3-dioxygenase-like lactoylglutathione lyase family enzyme
MELHPIMYVADQYAERDFYKLLGFEHEYEGDEFPGFLAVRHGNAVIGLQKASAEHPPYEVGLRWQFEITEAGQLDQIIALCIAHGLQHDVELEVGGDRFRHRLLSVRSPAGVAVCFEGGDEPGPV